MTKVGKVLGIVSWESIGARLSLGQKCEFVRQCMDTAEILEDKKPILEAITTIAEHGYVLVSDRDDAIVGIVTASDLSLQFMQLAEPFLRIGEIEGHLRNLIRGKFTVEQLQAASDAKEGRPIEGSADLTLGGYCQLLGNRANWELLGLNIDRKEFCSHLKAVRQIRNDLMHFNPDGLSEDDTRKLLDIARFFENLVRMGAM